MSDLGSLLRRRREELGRSLDEISELTKIHKRHLEAIEGNRWELLPEPFYTRAFLRHYAEHIDLDPEYVLSEYALETNASFSQVAPGRSLSERRKKRRLNQRKPRRWLYVVLLLVVIGIAFAYVRDLI